MAKSPFDAGPDVVAPPAPTNAGHDAGHAEAGPHHPLNSLPLKSLVAINGTTCGLRITEGTPVCWGTPLALNAEPPATEVLSQVALGIQNSCGVHTDGSVQCWGDDQFQLLSVPTGVFTAVSIADTYGCGLTQQAKVVCWGAGAPPSFNPSGTVVQLSSNDSITCARSTEGTVECHGDGTVDAVPVGVKFTDVSVGLYDFACGLDSNGAATCWGDVTMISGVAIPPADDKFVRLTVSPSIACGLHADGSARCWGYSPDRSVFDVPADERFSELAVGGNHVCGLRKTDSTVVCWGPDTDHQTEVPLSTK